jgi:hypothetical protein
MSMPSRQFTCSSPRKQVNQSHGDVRRLVLAAALAVLALASVAATANAAPVTVQKDPFSAEVTICNGDTVDLTGTLVIVLNGNTAITDTHTQGVVGIDETTGTVYHGEQSFFDIFPPDSSGGGIETFGVTTVLTASGGQTSRDTGLFHATVLPNGTLAVFFAKSTTACT